MLLMTTNETASDPLLESLAKLEEEVKRLPDPATAPTYRPYLPLFFTFENKPFTLETHFPMEPMYTSILPERMTYKCARQVGKSLNVCAATIMRSASKAYFKTLFVLPQYEMVRRLSSNYFRPLIAESLIKSLLMDSSCEDSVLQKTLKNRSRVFFSFAGLTVDRCRGLTVDCIDYDEVQDLNPDFVPIIDETMSASPWGIRCFTGTPKTLDNILQTMWDASDQCEWVIRCSCGYHNIPSTEFDVWKMIGPAVNVKRYGTGLICAKCQKPLFPQAGLWVPRVPQNTPDHSGIHLPQLILPMHCQDEKKWRTFLHKRKTYAHATFLNECLGESCDQGIKLISSTELLRACTLDWTLKQVIDNPSQYQLSRRYKMVVGGVDWGGGGKDFESTTTFTALGTRPDNTTDVIYMERLERNLTDEEEMERIVYLYRRFGCQYFTHDFAGGGRKADTLVRQARFVSDNLIYPFSYVATGAKNLVVMHPASHQAFRTYYSYDKTWSIALMLSLIKTGRMRFPKYTEEMKFTAPGYFADFLNLVEEKRERVAGSDMYLIKRSGKDPDDCVHSTNFAMGATFYIMDWFPDIAEDFRVTLSQQQVEAIEPDRVLHLKDWEDPYDEDPDDM